MIAATVIPLVAAQGDPHRAVAYASLLALMVGAIIALAGVFRLGFVAELLSRPTQIGYMNGLALTIVVGQLPKLFGFSVDGKSLVDEAAGFVEGVVEGDTVSAALVVGAASLVLIQGFQRTLPRVPGVLVAVLLSIATVNLLDLEDRGVTVVGPMPKGFPPFTVPTVALDDLWLLVVGALGIAFVSLTDTISTASVFAARVGSEVDGDREMIGVGAANLAAGLFQGFPVSTSGSRTAVAAENGAKSQLTGLVGAAAILLLLVLAPGLLRDLPQATLAAIVISASFFLADIPGMRRLWRQRTSDFVLAMAAFLGVAFLGVLPGIAIAVGLSIVNVFRRAWQPHQAVLGRVEGMAGYHDSRFTPPRTTCPVWSSTGSTPLCSLPTCEPSATRSDISRGPSLGRTGSSWRRADHRCRHHGGRSPGRSRPRAERRRDQPRVRRAQDPRAPEARTLRAHRHHRPRAFLRDDHRSRRSLP
jgi:MFS superfamily sulfate permease-like transporter